MSLWIASLVAGKPIVTVLTSIVKKHTPVVHFTVLNLELKRKQPKTWGGGGQHNTDFSLKKRSTALPPLQSHDTEMILNEALRHSHRPFTALSRAST